MTITIKTKINIERTWIRGHKQRRYYTSTTTETTKNKFTSKNSDRRISKEALDVMNKKIDRQQISNTGLRYGHFKDGTTT